MGGALDGVRVLEFTQLVAGPYCGVNLSDLGAEVVKIEPREGEPYRNQGAVEPHESKRFQALNRGKQALAIDVKDARGRAVIDRMLPGFDVVTVNLRPGAVKRLGIDYATLSASHPRLIYCDITGWGHRGPRSEDAATDLTMAAYSGLLVVGGKMDKEGLPAFNRPPTVDYATGLAAAMAICAALYQRERSGRGQRIEASLLRTALSLLDIHVMEEPVSDAGVRAPMMTEIAESRREGGSYQEQLAIRDRYRVAEAGPPRLYYEVYRAKDGYIALGCLTPANRAAACTVVGVSDEIDGRDFDPKNAADMSRFAQWKAEVERRMLGRTVQEWDEAFRAAGAPAAPVNFPEEMAADVHVGAAGLMWELEHPVTGPQQVAGPTVSMSVTPTAAHGAAPAYGRDSDAVLIAHGFEAEEVAALRAAGVIT